jgi:Tfp pilus assembly protein PilO
MKQKKVQSQRTWIAGGAVGAVAISALAWFGLVGPEFSSTSSLKNQTSDVQLQNIVLQQKVGQLRKQNDQIGSITDAYAKNVLSLPPENDLQDFLRQLNVQAALTKVRLDGVTAGGPSISRADGAAAPAGQVAAAGHLFSVPVSISTTGSLKAERAFLTAVQQVGPRRSLVTAVQFAPNPGSKILNIDTLNTMTLQVLVFVAPQTPAQELQMEKQLAGK